MLAPAKLGREIWFAASGDTNDPNTNLMYTKTLASF